jgi:hypothetical protein
MEIGLIASRGNPMILCESEIEQISHELLTDR